MPQDVRKYLVIDGRDMRIVGIWRRPLTAAEHTRLWNGGRGLSYDEITPPPSLVRRWWRAMWRWARG